MFKYLAFPKFEVKQSAFITKIKHLYSCLLNFIKNLYCFQAKILYFSKFVIDYKKKHYCPFQRSLKWRERIKSENWIPRY